MPILGCFPANCGPEAEQIFAPGSATETPGRGRRAFGLVGWALACGHALQAGAHSMLACTTLYRSAVLYAGLQPTAYSRPAHHCVRCVGIAGTRIAGRSPARAVSSPHVADLSHCVRQRAVSCRREPSPPESPNTLFGGLGSCRSQANAKPAKRSCAKRSFAPLLASTGGSGTFGGSGAAMHTRAKATSGLIAPCC